MNRYAYILDKNSSTTNKIIGIFPWGLIIDSKKTDHKKAEVHFLDEGLEFLQKIASKNISVVFFINQFKTHPLSMEKFQDFINSVEQFIKSQGVNLIGVYWCPGTEQRDPFVVPNPGMFIRVKENTGIDWKDIPVLSNQDNDLSAASKVGAKPTMIGKKHNRYSSYDSLSDWISSK